MKAYLVTLLGHGDVTYKLVDEEVFNWITNDDPGYPEPEYEGDPPLQWEDQTCPEHILEKSWKQNAFPFIPKENYKIEVTQNSYEDGRAGLAPTIKEELKFNRIITLMEYLEKNDITLEDEFVGYNI